MRVYFTDHCYGLSGKNRGGMEKRAMVFAAVEAVTDADAVWLSSCCETNIATEATAGELGHAAPSELDSVLGSPEDDDRNRYKS